MSELILRKTRTTDSVARANVNSRAGGENSGISIGPCVWLHPFTVQWALIVVDGVP